MRYFFAFLSSFLVLSVEADRQVSVQLKAIIDPVINIFRIDDVGDIDVVSGGKAHFNVVSNVEKGVEIGFLSENNWKLLRNDDSDASQPIDYECLHNGKVIAVDSPLTVDAGEFIESQYEFSTAFRVRDPSKKYEAGTYRDTVTVTVKSLD
jgi:hypothetical protein